MMDTADWTLALAEFVSALTLERVPADAQDRLKGRC